MVSAPCARTQTESGVPDDWTFHGTQQSPTVTCLENAGRLLCLRETLVVLDAVTEVGRPVTRIVFQAGVRCSGTPCPTIELPPGVQNFTTATVTFAGADQQVLLNLSSLSDGSIRAERAVAARLRSHARS